MDNSGPLEDGGHDPEASATPAPRTGFWSKAASQRTQRPRPPRMDRKEMLPGVGLSVVGVVTTLGVAFTAHPTKHHSALVEFALIGCLTSVALLSASLLRNRYVAGLIAALLGLVVGEASATLAFPFLAYAGWLIYRNMKHVRAIQAANGTLPTRRPRPARAGQRGAASAPSGRRAGAQPASSRATLASKRYTAPRTKAKRR